MSSKPVLDRKTTSFLIFIILVTLFICLSRYLSFDKEFLQAQLNKFPPALAGFVFVVIYVGVTFFIWLGPKDVFRLTAAYLVGPYVSTVWVYTAEMINLLIFFSLSRKLGREFVKEHFKGNWERVDRAVSGTSFWWVFFIRTFPVIPLRFADLGFGLTGIRLSKYLLISAVGTPLRIFVIQFFLALGMETVMNPEKFSVYLTAHPKVMIGGLAYFGVAVGLMFALRNKLRG